MQRIIYILFILFSSRLAAQEKDINWLSFEELETELIKEPKKVIVEFYADWCVYCKKMEQSVFSKSEIKKKNSDKKNNSETIFSGVVKIWISIRET